MRVVVGAGELAARIYDGDVVVLSRRDGRRVAVAGRRARFLARLIERVGLDDLAAVATVADEGHVAAFAAVRDAFAALDRAAAPTEIETLVREAPGFFEEAQRRRVPLVAMVELTYRCNLRCRHCYVLDRVSAPAPAHAATADVATVLHALADLGCLDVTLTGGETTLHRGWRELVGLARRLHLVTLLKTNATTFTPARAAAYAADAAHDTQVSIYGATADAHDSLTRRPGSFARTVAGLRALADAGVRCTVVCLVWSGNAGQLDAVEALARALGHRVTFTDVITGRLDGDRAPLALRIDRAARAGLLAAGHLRPFSPEACIAGSIKLKIEPSGALATCELLPASGPSAFTTPLATLWASEPVAKGGEELVRMSLSERGPTGAPVRSCPAMNQLDTGHRTGPTRIERPSAESESESERISP